MVKIARMAVLLEKEGGSICPEWGVSMIGTGGSAYSGIYIINEKPT